MSLTVKINIVLITNLYIPPSSSCTAGYVPTIRPFLQQKDTIILGDLNRHKSLWHSPLSGARGKMLAEEIGDSDFRVLNEDLSTRLHLNQDYQPTSQDDTSCEVASLPVLPYTSWTTNNQLYFVARRVNCGPYETDRRLIFQVILSSFFSFYMIWVECRITLIFHGIQIFEEN